MRDSQQTGLTRLGPWHQRHLRHVFASLAIGWLVLAVGFYRGADWATWIWPWTDSDMTYIFLASLSAAVAVPLGWLAIVNEPAAAAGLALDAAGIGGACAVSLAVMGISGDTGNLLGYAAGFGIASLVGWFAFRATGPLAIRDQTPLPQAVRVLFIVLIATSTALGAALVLRFDNVYAWDLPPRTSTLIGAWFMGAGLSFVFAVVRNSWVHAGSTLAAFLAYDAVQFVPYLRSAVDPVGTEEMRRYPTYSESAAVSSTDVNQASLGVYLSVIALGAAVAIYFLFIHRETRIWRHLHLEPPLPAPSAEST